MQFATWAWYCREDGESAQERMARVTDVPEWLTRAAASLITDPIELAVSHGRVTGLAGGHLRAAAMRQQRCAYAVVAHDWPQGEVLPGELLDPEMLRR